jgi:hypothetical protein
MGQSMKFAARIIAATALAFTSVSSAHAAAILDQSNEIVNNYLGYVTVGQSFTAGASGTLAKISMLTLDSYNGSFNSGPATVSIFVGNTLATGSLIASGVFSALYSSNAISYDISSLGISVASGTQYTFNLARTNGGYYAAALTGNNAYAAGNGYGNNGALSGDMGFRTYVDSTAVSAAPEPATWAMMIGGLAMVGGAIRRNRRVNIRFA